jgi:transposase-like protein
MARARPQSVATLECDFEQTLAFYALSGLTLEWIRTTSLLERTNRELRRKFCQVVTFGSHKGAEVAVYLQVQRLYARWSGKAGGTSRTHCISSCEISTLSQGYIINSEPLDKREMGMLFS